MKRRDFVRLTVAGLFVPLETMGVTISGLVTMSGLATVSGAANQSYVGNGDPGLLITAVNLVNPRTTSPSFGLTGTYYLGFGFWSLTDTQVPAIIKAICRRKNAGNSQIHSAYIFDDIDPCGNLQRQVSIDMSVGVEGDWICTDCDTPWNPGTFGVPYNVVVEEQDNSDVYYWDNTTATTIHGEWIYPGHMTWSTYAQPACTTNAGDSLGGTNSLYGPVNFIISNPDTAGDPI